MSKQAQAQDQASSSSSKLHGREVYFSNSKHNWLALANDQPDDLTHIDSEASITTSPASETKTVKPSSGLAPEVVKLPADDKADRCLLCHNRVECSTLCASCEGDVGASNKPPRLHSSDVEILKLHPGCTPKVVRLHSEYKAERCLLCYDKVKYSTLCAFCDEDIVDLDPAEKHRDYLLHASIESPTGDGIHGTVQDIHVEVLSRRKLYWILYADGEAQHFPVRQVRRLLRPCMFCPVGHVLHWRKVRKGYECDVCGRDIKGSLFYDCRECDFSECQVCHMYDRRPIPPSIKDRAAVSRTEK